MIERMMQRLRRFVIPAIFVGAMSLAAGPASAETVLITGASSGIGLEFVKEYAARGWTVIATHRQSIVPDTLRPIIDKYPKVRAEEMDVTNANEIEALRRKLNGEPIDVLINNAGLYQVGGTYENQLFGKLDFNIFDTFMNTNVKGTMMVTQAFIDNVRASKQKKIISISSSHGSVTVPPLVKGAFWYGASKAALNKMMATLSYVLQPDKVIVVLFHPGSVLTERQANLKFPGMIETTVSVSNMMRVIDRLTMADTGHFLLYDGSPQAW
jgi:NAD(P)-dependent dehydrogenase (short-subunit alcohol dehydrogenase family)